MLHAMLGFLVPRVASTRWTALAAAVLIELEYGRRRVACHLRCALDEATLLVVVRMEVQWIGHVLDGQVARECNLVRRLLQRRVFHYVAVVSLATGDALRLCLRLRTAGVGDGVADVVLIGRLLQRRGNVAR